MTRRAMILGIESNGNLDAAGRAGAEGVLDPELVEQATRRSFTLLPRVDTRRRSAAHRGLAWPVEHRVARSKHRLAHESDLRIVITRQQDGPFNLAGGLAEKSTFVLEVPRLQDVAAAHA